MKGINILSLDAVNPEWMTDIAGDGYERSSAIGVYDAKRERLLLGFGNSIKDNKLLLFPDLLSLYLR